MSPQRILGVLILAVGVVLLVMGINASHSLVDQASNTFYGRFTDHTTWYILGGIVVSLAGLGMVLFGPRGKGA